MGCVEVVFRLLIGNVFYFFLEFRKKIGVDIVIIFLEVVVGVKENMCRWEEVKVKILVNIYVIGKGWGFYKRNWGKSN